MPKCRYCGKDIEFRTINGLGKTAIETKMKKYSDCSDGDYLIFGNQYVRVDKSYPRDIHGYLGHLNRCGR